MSPQQLLFDLAVRQAVGREDFFVSPANELALRKIDAWQNWAGGKLVLTGPKASGKSHLVAVWAEMTGAQILEASDVDGPVSGPVAVENVDHIAGDGAREEALFHLHNYAQSEQQPLLMTGQDGPGLWGIKLPDLASRILAADVVALGEIDDALLSAVLVKLFDDRQLNVGPDVITFLTSRIDRSFAQAEIVVATLDQASMRDKRRITTRFAGEVLNAMDKD